MLIVKRPTLVTVKGPGGKDVSEFRWTDLGVFRNDNGERGLYATNDICEFTAIPIVGKQLANSAKDSNNMLYRTSHGCSHAWVCENDSITLDGHPSIIPSVNGVGCAGLAIAMMANEERAIYSNCVFLGDCLITLRDILQGEELTVFYGDLYDRKKYGYELEPECFTESESQARKLYNDRLTRLTLIMKRPDSILAEMQRVTNDVCKGHVFTHLRDFVDLTDL
jgi:hypothetical protein